MSDRTHEIENNPAPKPPQRLGSRIWRGVTLQLFLIAVLPLTVLIIAVTFGSLQLHHEAMRSLVADRNLHAVQAASASIEKEITHRGAILALLAARMRPGDNLENVFQGVGDQLADFDGGVTVIAPDGKFVAFAGGGAIRSLAASDEWKAIQSEKSAGQDGQVEYLPAISIDGQKFVPVKVSNASGVTWVGLFSPAQVLSEVLATFANIDTMTVQVVDPEFQVLFRKGSLALDESVFNHPGIQDALKGSGGVDYHSSHEGEHVISTTSVRPVGWALMVEESWEDIASPLLQLTQNAPLLAIPILGLSMLAIWFGLRQIVQPLQALEGKTEDLARGNFESIRQPVGGVPEIRHLQETLIEMAAQLDEAQKSLHSYIGAITDSVENERKNLARELHDDTLQAFIALGQNTQYALHWNTDPRVEKSLQQVLNLTDEGMKNLRRMVQGLRPIYIEDLGLATALAMQSSEQDRPEGVKIHFNCEGSERRLKPDVEMALYRIAQEATNNVIRHANAKNAWVRLHFQPESVTLEIRDDGHGFDLPLDPTHYARMGHYGLLSISERCELIGAKLTMRSSADEGTLLTVRLPSIVT